MKKRVDAQRSQFDVELSRRNVLIDQVSVTEASKPSYLAFILFIYLYFLFKLSSSFCVQSSEVTAQIAGVLQSNC